LKSFSFRFQTLLNVRELYEEVAERRFSEAVGELAAAVDALGRFRNEARSAIRALAEQRETDMNINIQLLYDNYIRGMRYRIDNQIRIVETARTHVEERREELMEKMKDRKTIESLQIKDYDRFLLEMRRYEQGVIDDLAILRSGRFDPEELTGAAM